MPIGFLGLGTMGLPMAHNLLRGGFELSVWNRSPGRAQSLREAGATVVDAPRDAAHGPLLFSMLADDNAVRATLLEHGVLDALPAGSVHVNMATISVALAHELTALHAERGVAYVAAPVLGRVDVAEAGKLNILAAGDEAALARVQPMFDVLGLRTWEIGRTPSRPMRSSWRPTSAWPARSAPWPKPARWHAATAWTPPSSWACSPAPCSPHPRTRAMAA